MSLSAPYLRPVGNSVSVHMTAYAGACPPLCPPTLLHSAAFWVQFRLPIYEMQATLSSPWHVLACPSVMASDVPLPEHSM